MNPWDILAWVAAISLSTMLTAITIAIIAAAIKPNRTHGGARIYTGRDNN